MQTMSRRAAVMALNLPMHEIDFFTQCGALRTCDGEILAADVIAARNLATAQRETPYIVLYRYYRNSQKLKARG